MKTSTLIRELVSLLAEHGDVVCNEYINSVVFEEGKIVLNPDYEMSQSDILGLFRDDAIIHEVEPIEDEPVTYYINVDMRTFLGVKTNYDVEWESLPEGVGFERSYSSINFYCATKEPLEAVVSMLEDKIRESW